MEIPDEIMQILTADQPPTRNQITEVKQFAQRLLDSSLEDYNSFVKKSAVIDWVFKYNDIINDHLSEE